MRHQGERGKPRPSGAEDTSFTTAAACLSLQRKHEPLMGLNRDGRTLNQPGFGIRSASKLHAAVIAGAQTHGGIQNSPLCQRWQSQWLNTARLVRESTNATD